MDDRSLKLCSFDLRKIWKEEFKFTNFIIKLYATESAHTPIFLNHLISSQNG